MVKVKAAIRKYQLRSNSLEVFKKIALKPVQTSFNQSFNLYNTFENLRFILKNILSQCDNFNKILYNKNKTLALYSILKVIMYRIMRLTQSKVEIM